MQSSSLLFRGAVCAVFLAIGVASAHADPDGQDVRGTVEALNGDSLVVRTDQGTDETVALSAGWWVRALVPASLSSIKPGDSVRILTTPVNGQTMIRALELVPRGAGAAANTDSTNGRAILANVQARRPQQDGEELTLYFPGGGTQQVTIPLTVPVVTYEPGERAMLSPGAHIFTHGQTAADGVTAHIVVVGKNGIKPPL